MKRARLAMTWVLLALAAGFVPLPVSAQRVPAGGAPPGGSAPIDLRFARVIDASTIEAWIDGKRVGIGVIGVENDQRDRRADEAGVRSILRSGLVAERACRAQAAGMLRQLLSRGARLTDDPELASTYHPFDARGRRLFHVSTLDGVSVSEALVTAGVVRTDRRGKDGIRLLDAEQRAKAERKGCVWQQL